MLWSSPTSAAAKVKHLSVIGASQMGLGIALVAARKAGVLVTLVDNKFEEKLLAKDVFKERITQAESDKALSLLTPTTSMDSLSVDFVIEAVPEILSLKFSIFSPRTNLSSTRHFRNQHLLYFHHLHRGINKDPTNTSASSRVISTHFMNPVLIQKGVEIITGLQTSQEAASTAMAFCKAIGKTLSQSADFPGFLANLILVPYINNAIICLETGVGGRDDIDAIMKKETNIPMGPLQLADLLV